MSEDIRVWPQLHVRVMSSGRTSNHSVCKWQWARRQTRATKTERAEDLNRSVFSSCLAAQRCKMPSNGSFREVKPYHESAQVLSIWIVKRSLDADVVSDFTLYARQTVLSRTISVGKHFWHLPERVNCDTRRRVLFTCTDIPSRAECAPWIPSVKRWIMRAPCDVILNKSW